MEKTGNLRLVICGMHIESGTLNPLKTRRADFLETRGADLMQRYPFLDNDTSLTENIDWLPLAHFRAMPGGVVVRSDYESMKQDIVSALETEMRSGHIDGVLFDIHGAMSVEELDDAELDLLESVRCVVGAELPISCCQDLHGNVTSKLVEQLNYITAYRTAPHVDVIETRARAMHALVRILRSGQQPSRAWLGIPVLLSGEMTSTEVEPGKTLWSSLEQYIDGDQVWDVSLWAGYPWADQSRAMASVVVTGMVQRKIESVAQEIANNYWRVRENFQFISTAMPVAEAFAHITETSPPKPIFLSDAGDNPTAGGAGDTTGVLANLLESCEEHHRTAIFASIPDEAALQACAKTEIGETITLTIGGKLDPIHSKPLTLTGQLTNYSDHDPRFGPEAVFRVANVFIILSTKRRPYHLREDFIGLGLDPKLTDITVVKIGYLEPELKVMAATHILLLSDGGVPPQIETIDYQNIQRPMFPWDR